LAVFVHGPGHKHERPILLAPWQHGIVTTFPRPFIRGLIHSDGWRGENVAIRHTELAIEYRTYTRYRFSNRSNTIRRRAEELSSQSNKSARPSFMTHRLVGADPSVKSTL
jgi:hypothetical protein